MHDIKYIRNNPSEFEKEIKKRNVKIDLNKILELDKINRSLIQKKETLESEKKKYLKQMINLYLKNQKNYLQKFIN